MAALVERDELGDEDVRAVARRLADFHARARDVIAPADHAGDVKRGVRPQLPRAARDRRRRATARRILAAERFAGAFVVAHRGELVRPARRRAASATATATCAPSTSCSRSRWRSSTGWSSTPACARSTSPTTSRSS